MTAEQYIEELMIQTKERNEALEEFKVKVWEDFCKRIVQYVDEYMFAQEDLLEAGTYMMLEKLYALENENKLR
ncbi:MAG: hypothetical protein ACI35O_10325 [Bacillaceae bacterium]